MANFYCRSTDGDNADTGATWALAKADLSTATTGALVVASGAGDVIYVSSAHAQSTSTTTGLTAQGTAAAPTRILCVSDAAEPPTTLATGATITTTSGDINPAGFAAWYGCVFKTAGSFNLGNTNAGSLRFDSCELWLNSTATSAIIGVGPTISTGNDDYQVLWNNTAVRFGYASQKIQLRHGRFRWNGGGLVTGSTVPTVLFTAPPGSTLDAIIDGVDLSAITTALVAAGSLGSGSVTFRNCKLASGVAALTTSSPGPGGLEVIIDNCDSGDTSYRSERHCYEGAIYTDTGVYRSGGATINTTPLSLRMVTSAGASFVSPLACRPIAIYNEAENTSKTVTIEIAQNNGATALTESEVWIEVEYLGTDGFPISSIANDHNSTLLTASATAQTASTETWTGLTTPTKQTLAVAFTPQGKGYLQARVCLAKPSTTIYVDPLPVVS